KSPRFMDGTSFCYFATEQFRYEFQAEDEKNEWGSKYSNMHPADFNALSARLGWLPSFPQWTQNSLDVMKEARKRFKDDDQALIEDVAQQLANGKINYAIENPNDPRNFPKVFFNWRSN